MPRKLDRICLESRILRRVALRTYLKNDLRRFCGGEIAVTIVDTGDDICSFCRVFIDVIDFDLKLLCRTMINRDDESIRCKYAVESILLDLSNTTDVLFYDREFLIIFFN